MHESHAQYDPTIPAALGVRQGGLIGGPTRPRDPHGPSFLQDQINRVYELGKTVTELNNGLDEVGARLTGAVDGILGPEPPTNTGNGVAKPMQAGLEASPTVTMEALRHALGQAEVLLAGTLNRLNYLSAQVSRVERI